MRIDHNNFTKFDIAYLDHSHNLIISILFLFRRGHRNMKYLTTCYDLGLTQLDNNKIKGITLKDDIIALGNFYQDLLCTTKYFKLLSAKELNINTKNIDTKYITYTEYLEIDAQELQMADINSLPSFVPYQFHIKDNKCNNHIISISTPINQIYNKLSNIKYRINKTQLEWLNVNPSWVQQYRDMLSKEDKISFDLTLELANIYKHMIVPFYLPIEIDFRGRIYLTSSILNYQTNILARELIEFYDSYTLSDNGLSIQNSLFDKYVGEKKPHDLLAGKNIQKSQNIYLHKQLDITNINYILYQDSVCSGLQHISGVLGEENMAREVKLIDPNKREDQYQFMAQIVNVGSHFIVNREIIKKSIMTIPYSVTLYGVVEQLINSAERIEIGINNYAYKFPTGMIQSKKDIYELGNRIIQKFNAYFPNISNYFRYMKEWSDIFTSQNMSIDWHPTLDVLIKQQYSNKIKKRVSLMHNGKRIQLIYYIPNIKSMDKLKNRNAISPNFIHSLDASLMRYYIVNSSFPIACIHDSFGSPQNNYLDVVNIVKDGFIDIYCRNNMLEILDMNFRNKIGAFNIDNNIVLYKGKEIELPILPNINMLNRSHISNNLITI